MTASVLFLNPESAFALARRVIMAGTYDEEAVEAALEVLRHSPHANDIATVRWLREYAPQLADMAQIDADALARDAMGKMRFLLCSIAVVGGIVGGVLMEAAITGAVAGVM